MKKVVIIEDNPVIQHLLKSWFMEDDFMVVSLSNTESLQEKVDEIKPNLIVTDIMLPNNTASDLINTFNKINCPVIVVSSMEEEDIDFFADKIGAIAAFTKPVKMEEMFDFINSYFKAIPN